LAEGSSVTTVLLQGRGHGSSLAFEEGSQPRARAEEETGDWQVQEKLRSLQHPIEAITESILRKITVLKMYSTLNAFVHFLECV